MQVRVFDEDGVVRFVMTREGEQSAQLPAPLAGLLDEQDRERLALWHASQQPVDKLRYPRAVDENRNKKSRGGHVWFQRHASPMRGGDDIARGLTTLWTDGELKNTAGADQVRAQALPPLGPSGDNPLHGYDLFSRDATEFKEQLRDKHWQHKKFEPFDPDRHARPGDASGGSQGPSGDSRRGGRRDR
jgi:hypothetical protein